MSLPSRRFQQGPLALWCGPQQPRGSAFLESPQGLAVVAGELLWEGEQPPEDGPGELPRLLHSLIENRPQELSHANGAFAALAWDAASSRLWLASDSLGGWPLYFVESAGILYFSTILEILLRIPAVPRSFDFAAFAEQEAFCYPLGDLTLYREIRVLEDSEYLCLDPSGARRGRYFDWSRIEFRPLSMGQAAAECAAALTAAVRDRAPRTTGAQVQVVLSGGLDSRCVTALLHSMGFSVRAATLRIPDSQDNHYAKRFASVLGIELIETPHDTDPPPVTISSTAVSVLGNAVRPFLPGRVFSGDGGGETFGFLLMPPDVMALLGRNEVEAAIVRYVEEHPVPVRPFRKHWWETIRQRPRQAMRAALGRWPHVPAQKAMHLFLLTNDLRRHLHEVFESAPRLGANFAAPFYDRRVIRSVLQLAPPLDPFLSHGLYYEILKLMPETCLRVPWQVYPGRLPCPVQDDGGGKLKTQWELSKANARWKSDRLCRRLLAELFSGRVPGRFVDVPLLAAAAALYRLGFARLGHLFRPALALTDAFRAGAGRPDGRNRRNAAP